MILQVDNADVLETGEEGVFLDALNRVPIDRANPFGRLSSLEKFRPRKNFRLKTDQGYQSMRKQSRTGINFTILLEEVELVEQSDEWSGL